MGNNIYLRDEFGIVEKSRDNTGCFLYIQISISAPFLIVYYRVFASLALVHSWPHSCAFLFVYVIKFVINKIAFAAVI